MVPAIIAVFKSVPLKREGFTAKVFSLNFKNNTNIFRYSVILKQNVDEKILSFALKKALEKACVQTIEDGKMTKDLALITLIENPTVLSSEGFIKAIRETLEGLL